MRTIYLLHFDRRLPSGSRPQHYLGSARDLDVRLEQHRRGTGAVLPRVMGEHGIAFTVAFTIEGDWDTERRLKRRGSSRRICPICKLQSA
jgi:predicted GIY-YIG superfamily endonuclease